MFYWGVDSSWNKVTESFYTEVARWGRGLPGMAEKIRSGEIADNIPAFWGRYLNDRPSSRTVLESSEVDILARHGCKLLLVYNGTRGIARRVRGRYVSLRHTSDDGYDAAYRAGRAARSYNIGFGNRIYADLENWRVNPAWIAGWWQGLREQGYLAGLYGNPDAWHFASRRARRRGLPGWRPASYDTRFQEAIEPEIERTGRGATWFFGASANSVYIWSSQAVANAPRARDAPPAHYRPRVRPGIGPSEVWQYKLGTYHRKLDLNLATPAGFAGMCDLSSHRLTQASPTT